MPLCLASKDLLFVSVSWITIVWSVDAALCFTLAGIYLLVWCNHRERWMHLLFSCSAVAAGIIAVLELASMRAGTIAQCGALLRWAHLPAWMLIVSVVWFVRLYLRAGRPWLAWSVCGLSTLALVLNFVFTPNLNFREITSLRHFSWWGGEMVSGPVGVPNPWTLVGQVSLLLLLIFCTDATVTAWRRGDRRRAILVGGSAISFITVTLGESVLVTWGGIETPFFVSLPYLGMIAAMGYELSHDLFRMAQFAQQFQASEAALRESEARFRAMADTAPVMIWMAGTDKLCTFFSKAWLDFTGRPLEREIGNGWTEGIHPEDFDNCLAVYANSFDARHEFKMEYRLRRKDGKYCWLLDHGTPRFAPDGSFLGYIGSCVDITERRQAEDRFRLAVEASPNGIVLVDTLGRIALVNIHAEKLFGYSRTELIGQAIEKLVPERFHDGHPDYREGFHGSPAARAMGSGRDVFARRKDGTEFPVEIGISPIQSTEGTMVLSVIVDISGRRQAEAEARQHHDALTHLGRVAIMGEMAARLPMN